MADDEPDPFPYGVASFEPTSSGVLIWTRVVETEPLLWEVATDADFDNVVDGGWVGGATGTEASQLVTIDDLQPATDHFYRFSLGANRSPVGRTRTLADDDRPVRLGLACCGDYSAGHFAAYRALARADVDLVVHLGDYVYAEVEGDLRAVDPAHEARTGEEYRARYAQVRRDPDLQALHQRHPMMTVIDDHDLADNAHRDGAKTHEPETEGPWEDRRDTAVAERLEWLPIRADGPAGRTGVAEWRSVRLGSLGELVLLDTRLAGRDPQADQGGPDLHDPARTILGPTQMRWARERVLDTTGPWSILVSSVVVNPMEIGLPGRFRINKPFPAGYLIEDGIALNSDGWDGYPADRDRLTEALRERGSGGVLLSGDVHSGWAFEGPSDGDGPVAVEFTCPAVTSEPMGEMIPVVGKAVEKLMAAEHGVAWVDLFARGHLLVDVGPTSVTATWYFSDSEDPAAEARRGASWTTHLDQPGRLEATDVDPEHDSGTGSGAEGVGDGGPPPETLRQRDRTTPLPAPPRPPGVIAAEVRHRRRKRLVATAAITAVILSRRGPRRTR